MGAGRRSLGDAFHDGALTFGPDVVERVTALSALAPTVLVVYLERPAILTPFAGTVWAIIGEFGAGDDVILAALFGNEPITGRPPFDLPSSMSAVEASREDVPFDMDAPLFCHGAGLRT